MSKLGDVIPDGWWWSVQPCYFGGYQAMCGPQGPPPDWSTADTPEDALSEAYAAALTRGKANEQDENRD